MVTHFSNLYGLTNVCMAGGVALNCVVNGKILTQTPVKQLWVQPAAGDAGGALGAALTAVYQHIGFNRKDKDGYRDDMKLSHLGPQFGSDDVAVLLGKQGVPFKRYQQKEFIGKVADALKNGLVIGWFNGRMEYGPRALGLPQHRCRLPFARYAKPSEQKNKIQGILQTFCAGHIKCRSSNVLQTWSKQPLYANRG